MFARLSKKRLLVAVALPVLLVSAAACGGDEEDSTSAGDASSGGQGGGGGGGGGGGDMTVEITSPEDGAEVSAPVELELDSSVDVGETDTGLHHFHVHYDGDAENYDIVYEEGAHTAGQDLAPGEHTVQLVLANADHSETDVTDEVTVTVGEGGAGGGGGGGGGDTGSSTTEGPYGY